MKKLAVFLSALLIGTVSVAADDHDGSKEDREQIKAAVFDYFHGQGEASAERLFRAFEAEHATMVGVLRGDDGSESVRSWKDMAAVLNGWAANQNPPGGDRDGEIISINMVAGRLAVVLFRSTDRFYDALTLGKVNGEWKIIAKAFVLQ